ncbi:MFS transporter [Blastococcus sp. TF02A_35]|uniref:MFS transporter n=1 Tax=Blastococcus sp. TF02A-35 TaxID=2559612 RepID=UPI0014314526|nr:MFS transporter [Blastococcus sp. TF02A_35]
MVSVSSAGLGNDFRRYWAGASASLIGSEITTFLLPVIAAATLGASPVEMSLLVAAGIVPNLAAPLFAGPLVDRGSKRRLLLATDFARAALLAMVVALWAADLLGIGTLILAALALGLCSVVADVGYVAWVPALVPSDALTKANGRLEASRSVSQVAGPGLGGLLLQLVSAPLALLLDVASYLFSAWTLLLIKVAEAVPDRASTGAGAYVRQVAEGFAGVTRIPAVRLLAIGSGGFNFFAGAAGSIAVLFVLRTLEVSPTVYGIALGLGAVGGVVGASVANRAQTRFGVRIALSSALALAGAGELILALSPEGPWVPVVFLFTAQLVASLAITVYLVLGITMRQHAIPKPMIGRVFASMRVISRGPMLVGALMGGWLAEATSLRTVLIVAATGQVLVGLGVILARRSFPER